MLDKVENPYQLGVRDTLVEHRVGSRGPDLEEFSDSSCGTVSGGGSVSKKYKVGRRRSYTNPDLNLLKEDDKSSKGGRSGEVEDESTIIGKKY